MDPITIGLLIGAATGMFKGGMDAKKEKAQRDQASAAQRWSPWTHIQAGPIQTADPMGSTMQGALAGASMGQQFGGGAPATGETLGEKSVPMQGAQNAAPAPAYDYSQVGGTGYNSYPGAGAGARPAYMQPGAQRSPWGSLAY